ncbi:hypothetical protein GC093_22685 [Paenibacillus sp. LMG 31456]|uniref:Uncharacterized protein n=1 Tax=Paenibacillus foliorum TaxID=2654974 RepID=A0A972K1R7_9BACL|nr:hypothetical protein [Paenibacillus foliorum]NOU96006.1 hypothetical protein [Paenibacillus foliorum]
MEKNSKAKNGADGQQGTNGTNASNGSDGQNAVSFTNLDENSTATLLDKLKAVPAGHSIDVINDNEILQITLNGKMIVNINKAEIAEKLQNGDKQNG